MKAFLSLLVILVLGSTLAACEAATTPMATVPVTQTVLPSLVPSATKSETTQNETTLNETQDLTRSDEQGAVIVEVKPDNLSNPGDELVFEISMNTHSVDLSMDLAVLATLTTDNGNTVQARMWDAQRGGHHVSGKLSFPATVDGKPFLDGATKLTLTIKDVDAAQRIFSWELRSKP